MKNTILRIHSEEIRFEINSSIEKETENGEKRVFSLQNSLASTQVEIFLRISTFCCCFFLVLWFLLILLKSFIKIDFFGIKVSSFICVSKRREGENWKQRHFSIEQNEIQSAYLSPPSFGHITFCFLEILKRYAEIKKKTSLELRSLDWIQQ